MIHMRTLMQELIGLPIILYCMIPKKNASRALKDLMVLKTDGMQQLNKNKMKDLTLLKFIFLQELQLFFVLPKWQREWAHLTFRNTQILHQLSLAKRSASLPNHLHKPYYKLILTHTMLRVLPSVMEFQSKQKPST